MTSPGHEWAPHEREGWSVCSRCGMVRNYDREPRFRVFAQSSSEDDFQGFAPESAPPALEVLAS